MSPTPQESSGKPCIPCRALKQVLHYPYLLLKRAYLFAFARPSMQFFNNQVLSVALQARGYNNCCDPRVTGEELFIRRLAATDPKFCLDVGANKGAYAERLLDLTQAEVVSFEPLPKAFAALSLLKQRFPGRFEAVNKGVGARGETLELHFGEGDSELASFSTEVSEIGYVGASNVNTLSVPVITLDSYYQEHLAGRYPELDLLKIDTEGFEHEVLLGAREMLSALHPKFVQIEYNWHQMFRGHTLFELGKLLPDYRLYQLLPFGSGLAPRDIKAPESNVFHYSNFVFIRPDIRLV